MHIEISAGIINGVSVLDFKDDMRSYMSNADSIISSFKAIKSSTLDLSGGVGNLQEALDDIDARTKEEETTLDSAQGIQNSFDDFLDLATRVDKRVADSVKQNKEEFYQDYPKLKPITSAAEEKEWYEKGWDWLCGVGEAAVEGIKSAWNWTKDTAKKAWDGIVDFFTENPQVLSWIVTGLCIVGSIIAIACCPFTGGASLLFIAGVSALSSAIIAGTQNITSQVAEKGSWGEIEWGSVAKDALIAGVIGGITGAIGAGLGGVITNSISTTVLGSTLLNSSSAAVRVATGAVIGSISETATGVLSRGTASAVESYMTTGSVDFGDVWDDAWDPQQMLSDATIGGVFGGITEYKQYKSDMPVRKYNESNRPAEKAAARGYDLKTSKNGTLDYSGTDSIMKTPDGSEIVVKIKATGSRRKDFKNAWEKACQKYGINKSTFKKVTWQHMDDYNIRNNTFTLQLVDTNAHIGIKHAGGCKQYEVYHGVKYN